MGAVAVVRHRRAMAALILVAAGCLLFAGACNAITGAHDRVVDPGDATTRPDRTTIDPDTGELIPVDGGGLVVDPPKDGGEDANGIITIVMPMSWETPNGAVWDVDAGGTSIIGTSTVGHAIIIPSPMPSLPSDDYTVWAVVRAPPGPCGGCVFQKIAEFGILARVQTDRSAVIVSSKWGQDDTPLQPFMGNFQPPEWNPTRDSNGLDAGYIPLARYQLKLNVKGTTALGKMWLLDTQQEPSFAMTIPSPWAKGRAVGFYTYGVNGAVIEKLEVTIP